MFKKTALFLRDGFPNDDGDDDVGDGGADDDDNAHHQDRQAQGAALIDNELLLQSCFPAFQFSGWLNTILLLFFIDGS